MEQKPQVTVVGAGPAGSECAWQLAKRGIHVKLVDMKPRKMTPAHKSAYFSELVCSNSLRSDELSNAVGLLKAEMRAMGSIVMCSADENRIPAGGALAVDRVNFSRQITETIENDPNIEPELIYIDDDDEYESVADAFDEYLDNEEFEMMKD